MPGSDDLLPAPTPTLTFLVSVEDDAIPNTGEKGIFGRSIDQPPSLRDIPVSVLQNNLAQTLEALRMLFNIDSGNQSKLPLKQVEVSFEVTASGKIALLGTGAELAGKGAITVTFGR
jgi:hypothetical protein